MIKNRNYLGSSDFLFYICHTKIKKTMKTRFTIKVENNFQYHRIASELIMLGYRDDVEWNDIMFDETEPINYEEFYVHVYECMTFCAFQFNSDDFEHFDSLDNFLKSLS